jgi:hypothetical protein
METILMLLGIIVLSLMCIGFITSITASIIFFRAIIKQDSEQSE